MNKRNFQDEEQPHEVFQTTRQKVKQKMFLLIICLLSKTQISKTIPSGGSFSSCLDNSSKTNLFSLRKIIWISRQFNFKWNT